MNVKRIFVLLFLSLALFACDFTKIDGNGKIVTKKIDSVKNISGIDASGAFTIIVNIGEPTMLEVTTDENLMKYIGLRVSDHTLKIYTKESVNPTKNITIKLTTPHLTEVELSGANDLKISNLDEKELTLECSGASSLTLDGKVDKLQAEVSGSAELNSLELEAQRVRLEISGVAEAKVTARKFLRISASGAAEIEYAGDPELVNTDVTGASSVKKIQTK